MKRDLATLNAWGPLIILTWAILVFMMGCATQYEVHMGDNSFTAKTYREMTSIDIVYKDFELHAVGVADDTAETIEHVSDGLTGQAAATDTMVIMGGPLVDSFGNPRPATTQEIAAQLRAITNKE